MPRLFLLKLAAAAAACVASLAHAVPVTYTFTGVTDDVDQSQLTVTGSITVDVTTLSTTTTSIGGIGTLSGDSAASSYATFSVGNGPASTIVSGQAGQTLVQLVRSDGLNSYTLSTQASSGVDVQSYLGFTTQDLLQAAESRIYQTPATNLGLGQAATFDTPGSFNVGSLFSASTGYHDFVITAMQLSSPVAAVPEPAGISLALAGLGTTVLAIRRRRRSG